MTAFQVFLIYLKLKGVFSKIHNACFGVTDNFYSYSDVYRRYEKKSVTFNEAFLELFRENGFCNNMLEIILYDFNSVYGIINNEDMVKALRRWDYFVRNNVILDNLKIGDSLTSECFGNVRTGEVISINKDFSRITISDGIRRTYVRPGQIKEVNGKPFEFLFHISVKGKEYGKKSDEQ
jgi:hypothetical protein